MTLVSVTSAWKGDQVFSKPRSDGSPVTTDAYGSGVRAAFTSPSGNISCQIQQDTPNGAFDGGVFQIDVHKFVNPTPPADATCTSNYGHAVQILPDSVKIECPSPAANPPVAAGPKLPAGSQLTFGGVTCLSTDYGFRCLDDDRQVGFMIGKNILATIAP